MARQTTRSRKRERAAATSPTAKIKSSKSSKVHKRRSNPLAQRPVKDATVTQKPTKTKTTVSAAGVFKKKSTRGMKHRGRRARKPQPTPEPELLTDLRDGINEARGAIDTRLKTVFINIHEGFLDQLVAFRAIDKAFCDSASATAGLLSAPLAEEQIETTFSRDGKRVTEIINIGKKIAQFNRCVEKEEAKLVEYWKQWEDLQGEFIELGTEVFGAESFGIQQDEVSEKGYKRVMELLDFEHDAIIERLDQTIEGIGQHIEEVMKASEQELEASAKQQQAKLLQALIQD